MPEMQTYLSKIAFSPTRCSSRLCAAALLVHVLMCWTVPVSAAEKVRTDCAVDTGPCEKTANNVSVLFSVSPKPVKVMRELTFTSSVKNRGVPVADASVIIDLTMPGMYMGRNVVRLLPQGNGVYEGKGVIIRCPSGGKIWQAVVTVQQGSRKLKVKFVFEVQ